MALRNMGNYILYQFPLAKGQVKFLSVVINYFTKWIEVKPLATITFQQVLLWKNVICRHGLPSSIIIDNERQLIYKGFEQFLQQLGVKHLVSSVEHPQTNGEGEVAKIIIFENWKRSSTMPKVYGQKKYLAYRGDIFVPPIVHDTCRTLRNIMAMKNIWKRSQRE